MNIRNHIAMQASIVQFAVITCLLPVVFYNPATATEVNLRSNGLTLNANLEVAEGRNLRDGVVMIVHGWLAHNKMELVETAQRALLDNGHSSLAINLSLGMDNRHGFYDCGWEHRHTQESAVDEIAAWIAWLREQGVDKIALMGHSRGANQVMVYAAEGGQSRVSHLVFLAPGTSVSKQGWEARFGEGFDTTVARAKALRAADEGDELMADTNFMNCPQAQVSAVTFLSYYDEQAPFQKFETQLPQIKTPSLVITGSIDERYPHIREKVLPYIDGDRIQLRVIEGAGHFFRDFNIDEAMEAVVEFLETAV